MFTSRFLGQTYYKFMLGWGIISLPLSLVGYLTFVKVWQTTFDFYHIPFVLVLIGTPLCLIIVGFVIGHMMIKHRVQAEINSLVNLQANPELLQIFEKLDTIIEKLDKGKRE